MSNNQKSLNLQSSLPSIEEYTFDPIKGYPMLHWKGKRPFTSTQYYPAQLKEVHGEETNGWVNKIFWGDNLQVMSHLLKEFRGKVDLVYIDPPFDSKADYKKKVSLRGSKINNDHNAFEEKQYTDIWTNDEYLQFMYERLILLRELISENGSLILHCDYHKNHYLRCIADELFGQKNLRSEIIWKRRGGRTSTEPNVLEVVTETLLWYTKSDNYVFNMQYRKDLDSNYVKKRFTHKDKKGRLFRLSPLNSPNPRPNLVYNYKGYDPHPNGWSVSIEKMKQYEMEGKLYFPQDKNRRIQRKQYLDEWEGQSIQSLWDDIPPINPQANERLNYPTQKPEKLLKRVILTFSNPGGTVFDCFMGSGTTQAVAMKLGRRFIGADINLGAIQTTTKRLINVSAEIKEKQEKEASQLDLKVEDQNEAESISNYYTGFEVYNVNHYDVFRNPVEARDILMKALEIQPLPNNTIYDGEKDGRMVKVMPVNRIATRADLNPLITGFDYKTYERRHNEAPGKPVEQILLVCMGHEPDLAATLQKEVKFKLDIEVVDILRDQSRLEFKRDSEAEIKVENGKLHIEQFYPMNLLQKLSLMKENVEDWRELTESVMIDWNYDGAVFEPKVVDVPGKNELVEGSYPVPDNAGTIRVKITDLLSESLEVEIN
jgi:adenine-specific DNA-methyltransferase